jgi:hypothetical protein
MLQKFSRLETVPDTASISSYREFWAFLYIYKDGCSQTLAPQISVYRALAAVFTEIKVYFSNPKQITKFSIAPYLVQTAVMLVPVLHENII